MFKKHKLSAAAILSASAAASGFSTQAFGAENWVLEEVIVTSQKRSQSMNDVSVAVTAVTSEDVKNYRIETALDIAKMMPNVDIKPTLGGLNPAITVRGIGLNDFNVNNNPSVGVYVDEIFLTSPGMLSFMMFDVERIEVLKGPQGTLYGRNSNGGAISIVTTKPTQETEGYVRLGYGDYDAAEIEAAIGGALNDNWAGRLSLRYDDRDGYHEWVQGSDDLGDVESTAMRGQLAYEGEDFTANFSLTYGEQEGSSVPGTAFGAQDAAGFAGAPCSPNQILAGACVDFDGFSKSSSDPFKHDTDAATIDKANELDVETLAAVAKFEWELENFTVTSITGYTSLERTWAEASLDHEPSITPYGTIDKDEEVYQFSQEVRLTGNNDAVDWIVGAFYSHDEVEADNYFEATNVAPLNDPILGFGGLDLPWTYDQETTSMAIFAHSEWHLSDTVNLVVGLRYSDESRDFEGGSFLASDGMPLDLDVVFFGSDLDGSFTFLTFQDDEINEDRFSGKLGIDYRPNDDWLIYGSVSTGFKSGGFSGDFTVTQEELDPYDPEEVTAYEVGFKGTLAESTVQLNGAIFYYDYSDMQTNIPMGIAFPLTNADKSTIVGGELELAWRPVQGLDVRLGVGVLDHELDDPSLGDEMPNAADLQYNGLVRYEFPIASALMLALQTDFKYTDDIYREATNDPVLKTDGYTIWNARVALFDEDINWELAAWVNNIEDEEYFVHGFNLTTINGAYMKFPGAPRTYGATLTYNF